MTAARKIDRVLLLFPPVRLCRETMKEPNEPLGIAYLASVIRSEVRVEVMDAVVESDYERDLGDGFSWMGSPASEIMSRIESFQPELVGMSCIFSSVFPVIRELCREIKKLDPQILTVVGGNYPSFLPEHCLETPGLDFIVLGEGENTFLELIRRLREGRELSDLDGLAYKDGDRARVSPRTRWIEDLDTIPFPARDLLPMRLYEKAGVPHSLSMTSRRHAPVITSRGCPARCIYCSSTRFWGSHYRFRSPGNVLDEIESLVKDFGIEEIQFEDDNLTADKRRAKAIFRGIMERGLKIRFNFPNGVALWTLDRELIELMARAGCYEMTLAYESGCQEVLDNIVKKPVNLEKAAAMTREVRNQGIRTDAFYIIGFPGETRQQIRETFDFARKMKTDMAYFFVANPLPGSELYRLARERNMLEPDFNFENLSYSHSAYNKSVFPKGELEKLAGREFVRYSLRSFARRPWLFLKRFFADLLLKRPRYALGILLRIWRRSALFS